MRTRRTLWGRPRSPVTSAVLAEAPPYGEGGDKGQSARLSAPSYRPRIRPSLRLQAQNEAALLLLVFVSALALAVRIAKSS